MTEFLPLLSGSMEEILDLASKIIFMGTELIVVLQIGTVRCSQKPLVC
jgi:hypothetical protein